jgi:CheY-like chemotaxis protein
MQHAEFDHYVRDALANLYDSTRLQTNPLCDLLVGGPDPGKQKVPLFRELLRGAIEALRPPSTVPFSGKEWLNYRVLWDSCVQRREQHIICDELGMSRASFYRHQKRAIDAVADLLWDCSQHDMAQAELDVGQASTEHDRRALYEAVKLARESRRQPVRAQTLLEQASHVIGPLAHERGLVLSLDAPAKTCTVHGDPAVLHQIVVNLLIVAMKLGAAGSLLVAVSEKAGETHWEIRAKQRTEPAATLSSIPEIAICEALLRVYGGQLRIDPGTEDVPLVSFTIPVSAPEAILIVDDDEDALRFYERCLQGRGYALRIARSGDEAWQTLTDNTVALVLLDVLMPREDGWIILQRLKTLPETADIPVVVCSVLEQPALAMSLGASDVLRKPIREELLVKTVSEVLAQEGIRRRPSRAGRASIG